MVEVGRLSANASKILSSGAYLRICDKKHCVGAYYKIATKNVVFAHICKHMGSFLSEPGQKEAVLHLKFNKSSIKRVIQEQS